MAEVFRRIGVVGAGAWGTALAQVIVARGLETLVWAHEPEVVASINDAHENTLFLPGVPLAPGVKATGDIGRLAAMDALLLVAPAQHLRAVAGTLAPHAPKGLPVVICAKGIEESSGLLMTEVLAEALPAARPAVLSGPTLAGEIAEGKPTAVTVAAADAALAEALAATIGSARFRPYTRADMIGVQIGGAVKNVMAIACGMVAGMGFGQNARAALLTLGLTEMTRLALVKGAELETMMGLSGLGDLVLTCTSEDSRNYSLGVEIGRGRGARDILAARRTVAEGAHTAGAVVRLAARLGIEMPIVAAVDRVVNGDAPLAEVVEELLSRPFRAEGIDREVGLTK
ncbi:MAG: NAD(P)H-dependent glycerol-3-phosphate dehydrogenase [Alphaproteobacteria bacterium]|nr:NAD(P)H-dependent glycerol-3-phosphate dehydrogenase [Alphaproteobacteria bacterium]